MRAKTVKKGNTLATLPGDYVPIFSSPYSNNTRKNQALLRHQIPAWRYRLKVYFLLGKQLVMMRVNSQIR